MTLRLCYLAVEAPREGQASYVHVKEIIAGLQKRGWDVSLVCPPYSERWRRPGLGARLLEYASMQLKLIPRLRQFDVIYVRAHYMALPIALAAAAMRVKVVHEINGPYEDLFVAYPWTARFALLFKFIQRLQFRSAAGLIAVTRELQGWAEAESGRAGCALIPNGANTDLFSPAAKTTQALPARYVVFFGGLAPWHGVETMLRAVADPEWPNDVALVIVGDGPEAARVREAASRDPRIFPIGRLPYAQVPGVVAGALAGLVPISDPLGRSQTGLAPIKLFETLSCGVPAIVSDLPGQSDFVREHQCGLVFTADDGRGLAAAVARVAADLEGALEMGRRGRAVILQEHSWAHRAAATDHYLRQLGVSE